MDTRFICYGHEVYLYSLSATLIINDIKKKLSSCTEPFIQDINEVYAWFLKVPRCVTAVPVSLCNPCRTL